MKRFFKISLIAAVSLIAAGVVLAGIGRILGGQEKLDQISERGVLQKGAQSAELNDNTAKTAGGSSEKKSTGINAGWSEEMDFDRDFPVMEGDIQEEIGEIANIRSLDIEAGGVSVKVKASQEVSARMETSDVDKAQFFVEEGTLHVKAYKRHKLSGNNEDLGNVTLYLPENMEFAETELEVGAGELVMEKLQTEKLDGTVGAGQILLDQMTARRADLEVGMGQMSMQNAEINNLEFEIGMGTLIYQGEITGNIDGECGMGSVLMDIDKRYQDFNYNIEAAMGNVKIGDQEFAGLASDQYINNGASQNCELSSSMGSIEIRFISLE